MSLQDCGTSFQPARRGGSERTSVVTVLGNEAAGGVKPPSNAPTGPALSLRAGCDGPLRSAVQPGDSLCHKESPRRLPSQDLPSCSLGGLFGHSAISSRCADPLAKETQDDTGTSWLRNAIQQ